MKHALLKSSALRGGVAALALGLMAGGAALAATPSFSTLPESVRPTANTPDIGGVWVMPKRITALKTVDGKDPPLLPAAKAEMAKLQAQLKANPKTDPVSDCLMHGVPRLLYAPYPVAILQEKQRISFVHEANHTFRVVPMDVPLPEEPDPNYLGYSVGKWEGNTLVIDSIGFNTKTWLDYSALPHSDKLKVQERYTVKGNTIEGRINITDPDTFSAPWSTAFTLVKKPGLELAESVCTRDHKATSQTHPSTLDKPRFPGRQLKGTAGSEAPLELTLGRLAQRPAHVIGLDLDELVALQELGVHRGAQFGGDVEQGQLGARIDLGALIDRRGEGLQPVALRRLQPLPGPVQRRAENPVFVQQRIAGGHFHGHAHHRLLDLGRILAVVAFLGQRPDRVVVETQFLDRAAAVAGELLDQGGLGHLRRRAPGAGDVAGQGRARQGHPSGRRRGGDQRNSEALAHSNLPGKFVI